MRNDDHDWRALGEQKYNRDKKGGSNLRGKQNLDAPPLGKELRGQVCYKLASNIGFNTWPSWAHGRVM
jgi:hypothetical protein